MYDKFKEISCKSSFGFGRFSSCSIIVKGLYIPMEDVMNLPYLNSIDITFTKLYQQSCYHFRCTKYGFFGKLINGAKYSQKRRYDAKESDAPDILLDSTYLEELYHKQNEKGYYSHLPLSFRPLSVDKPHWKD